MELTELKDKNYYEVLEISTSSTGEQVYQGYLRAKNAYSQEGLAFYSLMTKEECHKLLELIEEAYSIISDPKKRRQYDEARGINSSGQQPRTENHFSHENHRGDESQLKNINSTHQKSMTKLVVKQKFALDFKLDPEMEKEIEGTTEFTGVILRRIREYKKVDIGRMSEMTKVSKTYLAHIENEEVEKLPALVYVRGFVYQYAKCLKLNPEQVATSFLYRLKKIKGESS